MWRRKGLFEDFFREFEDIDMMLEKMFDRIRTLAPEGRLDEPLYYGFSVNIGPDGIPEVRTFGNVQPTEGRQLSAGVREPFADVIVDEERGEIIITAEVPGIEKKDIKTSATGTSIEITAETEKRKYYKRIPLRVEIDPNSTKATYNNGVLEIKAKLKSSAKTKDVDIKVE